MSTLDVEAVLLPRSDRSQPAEHRGRAEPRGSAERIGVRPMGTTLRSGYAKDSLPFREAGIPTITFHGLTHAKLNFLHTRRDRMSAINRDAYLDAYRLLASYLEHLDRALLETDP